MGKQAHFTTSTSEWQTWLGIAVRRSVPLTHVTEQIDLTNPDLKQQIGIEHNSFVKGAKRTWPSHQTYNGPLEQEPPDLPSLRCLGTLQPSLDGSLLQVEDHNGNMPITTNAGATMSQPVDSSVQRLGPYVYPAG